MFKGNFSCKIISITFSFYAFASKTVNEVLTAMSIVDYNVVERTLSNGLEEAFRTSYGIRDRKRERESERETDSRE